MKTIAIVNQKGGVGKTTITSTLLHLLSNNNLKVLGIDLDPQANLSLTLLKKIPNDEEITSYHLLTAGRFEPAKLENFDLIPSSLLLANAEPELLSAPAREYRLSKALKKIEGMYDVVVIDTPPNLGTLTLNALMASDGILIPVETRFYGLAGLKHLFEILDELKEFANKNVDIIGIIPTFFEKGVSIQKEVLEELKSLNYKVLPPIPKRSAFQYASVSGKSVFDEGLDKETQEVLKTLSDEVIKWLENHT
jgi:chromosome partitioning protein